MNRRQVRRIVQENFPSMIWALDHPELGKLLDQAAEDEWSPLKLQGRLQGTKWWKRTSERSRELKILKETDPKSYRTRLDNARSQVVTTARQAGLPIGPKMKTDIAKQLMVNDWDSETLVRVINARSRKLVKNRDLARRGNVGRLGGAASEAYRSVEEIEKQYLLTLGRAQKGAWVRKIVTGSATVASMQEYAEKQALAQMPWLRNLITQDLTPAEALSPYREQFVRVLEMNPNDVNFRDGKVQRSITKDGRLATAAEAAQQIRENYKPRWERTSNARQTATELTGQLAEMFGRRDPSS